MGVYNATSKHTTEQRNGCRNISNLPDMQQYNISEYLSYNELDLIAGDPEAVDYDNMTEEEKDRYDKFVEAWYAKCNKEGQLT